MPDRFCLGSVGCQFCAGFSVWELKSHPEGLCFLASHSCQREGRWLCLSVYSSRSSSSQHLAWCWGRCWVGLAFEKSISEAQGWAQPSLGTCWRNSADTEWIVLLVGVDDIARPGLGTVSPLPMQLHLRAEAPQFSQLTAPLCLSNCFTVPLGQKTPRSSTYYIDWSPNFSNYLCSNSFVPVGLSLHSVSDHGITSGTTILMSCSTWISTQFLPFVTKIWHHGRNSVIYCWNGSF